MFKKVVLLLLTGGVALGLTYALRIYTASFFEKHQRILTFILLFYFIIHVLFIAIFSWVCLWFTRILAWKVSEENLLTGIFFTSRTIWLWAYINTFIDTSMNDILMFPSIILILSIWLFSDIRAEKKSKKEREIPTQITLLLLALVIMSCETGTTDIFKVFFKNPS